MKLPQAWITAGTKKEVSARIDMSAEVAGKGLCPECKQPMINAIANGHAVLCCHEDRIAVPAPDEESIEPTVEV